MGASALEEVEAAAEEEAVDQQWMIQEPLECVVVDVMVVVAVVPFHCCCYCYFVVLVARVCPVEVP